MSNPRIDKTIFGMALAVIFALCVPLVLDPEAGAAVLVKILDFTTTQMGWLYLWFTIAVFGFLIWLGWGKYGTIRFGKEAPEFSTASWLAMLFCAGIGSGVLYWGTIEWAYYYLEPPFGIEPRSLQAGDWGATYGLFHWGFSAWAIYCLPTLPIAYAIHARKVPILRLSAACKGVIGDHADGMWGKIIDVLFMFGLIGGIGTGVGLGTPMLAQAASELFGIERTFALDAGIVIILTGLFGFSAYSGLKKGIKILSDVNIYLAAALALFVILAGPTTFIISTFTNSVGLLLQNFFRMSLYTDPIIKSGFPEKWTIFYWAWWVTIAPFMGLFVARISRGRTIRQLIVAECVGGTIGCWAVFAILGNTGLFFELNGVVPVTEVLQRDGAPAAIVAIIMALPAGTIVLVLFLVVAFVFLATTLDSSAYTLASVATENLTGDQEPSRWHRVFWAVVLGAVALSLMSLGGLEALQTSAVVAAFPLLFVLGLMTVSFVRWLREDHG